MSRPGFALRPTALLDHAERLAGVEARRSEVSETDLRRCVSACYYALFHAVSASVAAHLLPRADAASHAGIMRSVDHEAVGRVCRWIARGATPPTHVASLVDDLRAQPQVVALADTFLELMQRRLTADYDPLVVHHPALALERLRTSQSAVGVLTEITFERTPTAAMMYALIALTTRIR